MRWSGAACRFLLVLTSLVAFADPVEHGRQVFLDRELGHCVLCHTVTQLDAPFQGNIGPDLSDIAVRLSVAEMRGKIADPTVSNPQSTMPAYQRTQGLRQVSSKYVGKPILNEQQMSDLLAFMSTLTGKVSIEHEP